MNMLKEQIKGCTKCKELVSSRRQVVPGDGSVPARVLFVGLAPGRNGADITGIPFTRDPSGNLFRETVAKTNIENYFVTNIVKCNPKDSKGRNRTPSAQEIENCREFLSLEISKIKPYFVVPLGKNASEFFLGPIKKMKTIILKKIKFDNFHVVPLLHPSYVIRGAYRKDTYINDFLKLKRAIYDRQTRR